MPAMFGLILATNSVGFPEGARFVVRRRTRAGWKL